MGRSVSYASGSLLKAYYDISSFGYDEETEGFDEYETQFMFEDFIYELKEKLKAKYKSLTECNEWLDREDHAILENKFAYVGISEYMGLVCLWVVPKDEDNNLAIKWCEIIEKGFYKSFGDLNKVGTFSNGESVFERRNKNEKG